MKRNKQIALFLVLISFWSCRNDDDGLPDVQVVPPRPLSEVAAENDAEIREFLSTHFYNYEEFDAPTADFDFEIRIDTIAGEENGTKVPLIDQVEARTVKVSAFEFNLEGEEDVEHTYYVLGAREGSGIEPTIGDSTFVRYQGLLLDGTVFDEVQTGVWWDNPSFQFAGVGSQKAFRGVGEGVTNIAAGNAIVDNGDGTFEVDGHGVGMIIFPSALATFNGNRGFITAYSPLIFKVDVLVAKAGTDHDNDGIPSILEDIDADGILVDEDTNGDRVANFQDPDDDGDGILTIEEIELDADGNFVGFKDTDGDGTFDHLDSDS